MLRQQRRLAVGQDGGTFDRVCWTRYLVPMLIAMSAAFSTSAGVAGAAPYTVWACADGAGHGLDEGDWRLYRHPTDPLSQADSTCGNPAPGELGRLRAIAQATAYTPFEPEGGVGWTVAAPPGTTIGAFGVWWARHINPESQPPWGYLLVSTESDLLYVQGDQLFGEFSAVNPAIAYGAGNYQGFNGLNARGIALEVMCQTSCDRAGNKIAGRFDAYRLRLTLEDGAAPTGTVGGLADGARIDAPLPLGVRASDIGGGVRDIALRVDGATVDSVAAGGRCADVDSSNDTINEYARVKPCPDALDGTLTLRQEHLDTTAGHTATVVATDAAGQQRVIGEARVARAAPAGFYAGDAGFVNPDLNVAASRSVNGSNGGPARVQLSFVVTRKRGSRVIRRFMGRQVVDYGQRALYRGRLTSLDGQPIVGARVWRAVSPRGQGWRLSGSPLITSKTGRVVGRTPSRGGNRKMQLVYFPYSDTNEHATTPPRSLRVRASTTIQLDQSGYRNGDVARFSGRIVSGPVLARKVVYLQALVRRQWRTFDTTRADAHGRWRLHYRFSATRRLTAYRFRAVVPAEELFPWSTGRSRVVRVLVVP